MKTTNRHRHAILVATAVILILGGVWGPTRFFVDPIDYDYYHHTLRSVA